jgi:hypothetical protein
MLSTRVFVAGKIDVVCRDTSTISLKEKPLNLLKMTLQCTSKSKVNEVGRIAWRAWCIVVACHATLGPCH